jgi:hypothetical protein
MKNKNRLIMDTLIAFAIVSTLAAGFIVFTGKGLII